MGFDQHQVDRYYRQAMKEGKGLFGSELSGKVRSDSVLYQFGPGVGILNRSVLDVGCGTGDLLHDMIGSASFPKRYLGVDVLEDVIDEAKKRVEGLVTKEMDIQFKKLDYSMDSHIDKEEWDYIVAISAFDRKFGDIVSSKQYTWPLVEKMIRNAKIGTAITFLSAYKTINDPGELLFTPEEVMQFARQLTERVMIDYSYAPQAFTLFTWNEKSRFRKAWEEKGAWK